MLTLSVSAIAWRRTELEGKVDTEKKDKGKYAIGLLCMLVEVGLSGWVGNYFEKHLKDKAANFSVWARNIQISSYSMLIFLPMMYMELAQSDIPPSLFAIFTGWSYVTWTLALLGAVTGFLVAFATKLTDSVTKTLAGTMGLILTYVSEVMILGLNYDMLITLNSGIAILCVLLYNQPLEVKVEKSPAVSDVQLNDVEKTKLLISGNR